MRAGGSVLISRTTWSKSLIKVLFAIGTRPEAIKLAPVISHMRRSPERFSTVVCVTGQHREMLNQVWKVFQIQPDMDLALMRPGQTLLQSTATILSSLETVVRDQEPDMLVVQGDTTTTFCGALAGFYSRIPVAHVEAGLRTGDMEHPFPEEANRVMTGRIASIHLAATASAADNLQREGVNPRRIVVTGNSGIDAVLHVRDRLATGAISSGLSLPDFGNRKLITVTTHRRENHGRGIQSICDAIRALAASRSDVHFVIPVHPNPNVRRTVESRLTGTANVHLIQPLDYLAFVDLMSRSYLLLTDSGGIQEEAPSLGKPVLVMREKTERPEAVAAGTSRLVGTDAQRIVSEVQRLLNSPDVYLRMAGIRNPYGDGSASRRIADAIHEYYSPADACTAALRCPAAFTALPS